MIKGHIVPILLISAALGVAAPLPTHAATKRLAQAQPSVSNGIDNTPAMGWNSWYGYGMTVNETVIKQVADAMVSRGFLAAGYTYCNIDDGWPASSRDANGNLQGNPTTFPSGMLALANYVHADGLKFGLYECAGTSTCGGCPGCYGHYTQDAMQYAAWGIDHMKLDWCNTTGLDPQTQYTQMSQAITSAGHAMNFNMCEWGVNSPWVWGPAISNSWRIATDSGDAWSSFMVEYYANIPLARYAGANHWNDPDYLMGGLGGCTYTEYQTQFGLWCELAAPLFLSANAATMSQTYVNLYTNPEAIAVDQDTGCVQGAEVGLNGNTEVLCKPLGSDGTSKAVVLLNTGTSAANITVNWSDILLASGTTATVRDLWNRVDLGAYTGAYTAVAVPAHGTAFLKIVGTPTPFVNLALSGSMSASSTWSAGYEAFQANDGNLASRWNSASGMIANQWLQVDLGSNVTVNETVIKEDAAFPRITGYMIQTSTGSNTWTTQVTGTTAGTNRVDTFAPTTARFVRVYVTSATQVPTLDEFQVFNTLPQTPTGLTAASGTGVGQILLNWSPSAGAQQYLAQRSTAAGGSYSTITTVTAPATTFTDSDPALTAGQTYYYQIAAANTSGTSSYSAIASAQPYVPPNYNGWVYSYFGINPPAAMAADTANPANDGLPNLLKYALGLSPLTSSTGNMTLTQSGGTFQFTYRRPANRSDITYTVLVSPDLSPGSWTTSGVTNSQIVTGDPETWQAIFTTGTESKLFFRLQITQP